ncbi:MAG: threonine-phosphate decarboxylase CobD [Gammaproteobacteria bacterium]|nr:threonine-phosphate decarboxylase CobD [Gammaproteobacteria bacterium]
MMGSVSEGLHGGNLSWACETHGGLPSDWLDISTGINPYSYAVPTFDPQLYQLLPQAHAEQRLVRAARIAYACPIEADVALANGTQALIQWLPQLRARCRVAIVGFTYSEHAAAWARAGHSMDAPSSIGDVESDIDVVVLTNPNNPDGHRVTRDALLELHAKLHERGGWLVVDEAFADCDESESMAAYSHLPGLIVLRSFGKFYGLAGVRLGVALCESELVVRLRAAMGPWTVSGPALAIGAAALEDRVWRETMRDQLAATSKSLVETLNSAGWDVLGSTGLFVLARHQQAQAYWNRMVQERILVRRFVEQPQWLRFGLAKEEGMQRLARFMARFMAP